MADRNLDGSQTRNKRSYMGNRGLEYYRAYPRDFFEGTTGLDGEVRGFYRMLLDLLYMKDGHVKIGDFKELAPLMGYTKTKAINHTKKLIRAGKLSFKGEGDDALIWNERVERELEDTRKYREQQARAVEQREWKKAQKRNQNEDQNDPVLLPVLSEKQTRQTSKNKALPETVDDPPRDHKTTKGKNPPSGRSKKGERLPEDWKPNAELVSWAQNKGMNDEQIDWATERFCNYWIAKSGKDATKRDWGRTWQNWILRDLDGPTNGAPRVDPKSAGSRAASSAIAYLNRRSSRSS